jgi:hypothetical protein
MENDGGEAMVTEIAIKNGQWLRLLRLPQNANHGDIHTAQRAAWISLCGCFLVENISIET